MDTHVATRPPRVRPRSSTRVVVVAAALFWAGWPVIRPAIEIPLYGLRLAAMPAPARLPVPVEGIRPQNLRNTWSAAREGGRRHEGIDIFARRHTAVLSSTSPAGDPLRVHPAVFTRRTPTAAR